MIKGVRVSLCVSMSVCVCVEENVIDGWGVIEDQLQSEFCCDLKCAFMCLCVLVCACVCHAHTHTRTHTHTYTHTNIHTYTHTHTLTRT